MDFKALRAAKNKKAQSMIESSGGKVDSSTWTPSEPLDADAKTGMRPISRRAFKVGGKVDGDDAKTNLSRTPRGNIGLANTNQRIANEERDGVKHVGGFKRGGMADGGSELAPKTSPRPMKRPADLGMEKVRPPRRPETNPETGKLESPEETQKRLDSYSDYYKNGGRAKKANGGSDDDGYVEGKDYVMVDKDGYKTRHFLSKAEKSARANPAPVAAANTAAPKKTRAASSVAPAMSGKSVATGRAKELYDANLKAVTDPNGRKASVDLAKMTNDATNMATAKGMGLNDVPRPPPSNRIAPVDMPTSKGIAPPEPITVSPLKRGGMAKKKYEGSPKDNLTDARMAKKKGMTHAEWEKSPEDKRMDAKGQREMDQRTKKADGGHAKDCTCKACGGRMARATGGRAKGTTNISINVMPHNANKPMGIQPPMPPMPPMPMPPVGGPPPMPMAPPAPPPGGGGLPPGLMAAMSGAAGTGPMPPSGPPPMMGRKSGGKVYPKMQYGSGGGKGRLEKIDEYGKNA